MNRRETLKLMASASLLNVLPMKLLASLAKDERASWQLKDLIGFLEGQLYLLFREEIEAHRVVNEVQQYLEDLDFNTILRSINLNLFDDSGRQQIVKKKYPELSSHTKMKLQLFLIERGESHVPHGHHNLISNQVVLSGDIRLREFNRLESIDDQRMIIESASDRHLRAGASFKTTEDYRNIHWFGAEKGPTIVLNFNMRGIYDHRDLFNPERLTPSGRESVDIRGVERISEKKMIVDLIEIEQAKELFQKKPVSSIQTLLD